MDGHAGCGRVCYLLLQIGSDDDVYCSERRR